MMNDLPPEKGSVPAPKSEPNYDTKEMESNSDPESDDPLYNFPIRNHRSAWTSVQQNIGRKEIDSRTRPAKNNKEFQKRLATCRKSTKSGLSVFYGGTIQRPAGNRPNPVSQFFYSGTMILIN